jgi:hypothetical protein
VLRNIPIFGSQVDGSSDNGSCRTVHNTDFTTGTPIKVYETSWVCGTYERERNSYVVSARKFEERRRF